MAMSGHLLTADQVAALLGVPESWVYEQSRKGRIPTVTTGSVGSAIVASSGGWEPNANLGEGKSLLGPRPSGSFSGGSILISACR